jgi:hypothetical protein
MTSDHPIDRLAAVAHGFGRDAAREKQRLLGEIPRLRRLSARRVILLQDTLNLLRAYPDNESVLRVVGELVASLEDRVKQITKGDSLHGDVMNTGLPGSCNAYAYSYAVLQRLVKVFPGCVDIDWEEVKFEPPFVDSLNLTVHPSESRGLEDEFHDLREWLQHCKTDPGQTDLEVVLRLFRESPLDPRQQAHVFETCAFPIVFRLRERGSGRCEIGETPGRIFYQKKPLSTARFPLKPKIKKQLDSVRRLGRSEGQNTIDLSLAALCNRNLEINPLIYANPVDVTVADGGHGLRVVLAGMVPEFRSVLESDFFFLIMKNGVPIAYGPASVFLGCCEMGINLFPEFRGGEIRYIYSQLMRALYHLADVRYFFLTSYGMGDGNPEALKSGAFWFYRKLGFKAADPDIEALASEQEAIMRRKPRYRCSMSVLRELSYTDAYFDLSGGALTPLNFEHLGVAATRFITERFRGDRARAAREIDRALIEMLGISDYASWKRAEKRALTRLSPVFAQLHGLQNWPAEDKHALAAAIKGKGGSNEYGYIRDLGRVRHLARALHDVAAKSIDNS